MEEIKTVNCANCRVPLTTSCIRNKLSTKFSSVGLPTCDSSIYELFSQIFKLRQTVVNALTVPLKDQELCRYCTSNFSKLVQVYQKILSVSNETGSTFSRIIVQSKGRPGRPPKVVEHSPSTLQNSSFTKTCTGLEEDEVSLEYLGLTRKRRSVSVKTNNVTNSSIKRRRRGKAGEVDTELLIPEVSLTEIVNQANDKEDPSANPEEVVTINHFNLNATEQNGDLSPDSTPISCKYCGKHFKHPQRLKQHLKTHHETLQEDGEISHNNIDNHEDDDEEILQTRKTRNNKPNDSVKKRGRPPKYSLKSARPATNSNLSTSAERKSKKTGKSHKGGAQKEDYTCKVCKKKFNLLQLLNQHMKIHVVSDKKCTVCDKKFKNAALLKRHSLIHKKDTTAFKCEDCDREFPNLLGLQVHAVSHTRQLYTCKGCKRKFKIEKNYIQHQETARCTEKKHPCPVETCGKLFKNKDKVKRHLISMHSEKKPFGCELCGKGFRSQADLKFHEVNAHICGESKQYVCDQCGKRFKSLETLKSHEMYSHKMEKKHFCLQCNKGFPLLATLKIHTISHSTDRPHMCSYCGRTYKHANDLKSHEVVHYRDEEKPFVCPICMKRYHRKDVLRLHQGREKHFAPDIPVPPSARKLASLNAKPKRATGKGLDKTEEDDQAAEGEEDYESGDSNSSLSSPQLSTTLSTTQPGPSGGVTTVSLVQNLSTNPQGHLVFSQTNQFSPGMQILSTNPPANQHHHLVPIMHHSNVNANQQQHGNVSQPPLAPGNEAISDFYRIMYDLS